MAAQLNPYLTFPGTARDAMTFYQQVLGGDLTMNTFGEFGQEGEGSDGIMHAQLETPDGFVVMAADTPSGVPYARPAGIAVSVSGDDEAALQEYWDKLSDGGSITMPFDTPPWGGRFGMLTDRFGIDWMVAVNAPE